MKALKETYVWHENNVKCCLAKIASRLEIKPKWVNVKMNSTHHTINVDDALELTSLERKTCHTHELINIYALDFISFNGNLYVSRLDEALDLIGFQ